MAISFESILLAPRLEVLMRPGETKDDTFIRLAKWCHPDKWGGSPEATEVFKKLNELRDPPKAPPVVIGKWTIREPFAHGDIANLYYTDDQQVFKIARARADNDLMDREKKALEKLFKEPDRFNRYVPALQDSLVASTRRANVIQGVEGFMSLEDIAAAFKGVIDFRHVVWMMNRALSTLGWVHRLDVVHGAIVPSHLLYRAENHDFRLVDWCYSTENGQRIPAMVSRYKRLYAPEVPAKRAAGPGTDLYMLAKIFNGMTIIPSEFRPLFGWCLTESPSSRPQDAWKFLQLFLDAAKTVYGEPKFVSLVIPTN